MELDGQGVSPAASADQPEGGQGAAQGSASAVTLDPRLEGLIADSSADASAAPQGQGVVQGGMQGQTQQEPDEMGRRIQSEIDKVRAGFMGEKYQLEQRLNDLQQRVFQQQQQSGPQQNPHDYNTDFPSWFRYEQQAGIRIATEQATRASEENLRTLVAQASESQWAQAHPGVDVGGLKAFNRANGIADWNLEAGYKLMNYPTQMASVAQKASQQTINSFRQPNHQNYSQPVRGNNGSPQSPSFDFKKLVEAAAVNPSIIDALSETDQKEFWAAMERIQSGR
jgi:hypothetical protein